jgi:hypothetical protein
MAKIPYLPHRGQMWGIKVLHWPEKAPREETA